MAGRLGGKRQRIDSLAVGHSNPGVLEGAEPPRLKESQKQAGGLVGFPLAGMLDYEDGGRTGQNGPGGRPNEARDLLT